MKKFRIDKNRIGYLAVLLCVSAVLLFFVTQKEGYHMDELLSFELSNAEYNPWIVPTQPVGRLAKFMREEIYGDTFGETVSNFADTVRDVVKNRGNSKILQYKADVYQEPVWISAQQFQEYLTVNTRDRFNYLSVYFNVKDDNHPPLHFMLLHTMSSFFPNVISPLLGCVINILAILGCIIYFFRIGTLLERKELLPAGYGKTAGICAGLLYGVSCGAIATALLIRMYGLMTFFCVALFYVHMKKWLEKGFEKKNKKMAAVTVLGFLTQYFFLFYCLTLALVTVVLLAVKKRYRELRAYIIAMATAAVIGIAVFPFAIQDVFASGRGEEALQNLGRGLSGYGTRLAAFGSILLKESFGGIVLGVIILICLAIAVCMLLVRRRKKTGETVSMWLMLLLPPCCYFLLAARMSPYLVDRYIMPLFPFVAMVIALILAKLFSIFRESGRYWVFLPVLVLGLVNVAAYDGNYLYRGYEKQLAVAEQYGDLSCICLYEGYGFYYNLMEFTQYEKTLLLKLSELERREDTSELEQLQQLVVLKKSDLEEESVTNALKLYGWEIEKILLGEEESVYGDTIYLCIRSGEH